MTGNRMGSHRTSSVAWRKRQKAKGLCLESCGRHRAKGRARCPQCLEWRRAYRQKEYRTKLQQGICIACKRSATAAAFCFTHWFRAIGSAYGLGNAKGVEILQRLWSKQSGCCSITGEVLVPGTNASLDHIVPRSKGGSNQEDNLQWVLRSVNRVKSDMTNAELYEFCQKVIQVQSHKGQAQTCAPLSAERSN